MTGATGSPRPPAAAGKVGARPLPAVLLLGNYRPTIALVRDLKARGYRTVVGTGGGEGGAEFSRFTDEAWSHPALEEGREAFLRALEAFLLQRRDVGVVFPVAESFVRVVSGARDRLPSDRVYALPPRHVVAIALDKMATWRLAESADVPVAPRALATTLAELGQRCDELGYPVVLRPLDSTRRLDDRKALIIGSPAELAREVPGWPDGHAALLVQRCAKGRRHNVYFAARAGRIVRIVETVIGRTDHPDDTGLAVEGETVPLAPDLARHTGALVARLDYSGVGCAQFLVDRATGSVSFLELNPRIAGNHAIAEAAGLELGHLSIVLAARDPPAVPFVAGRPGLVFAWTYGDLRGLASAVRKGLGGRDAARWAFRILRALARARVHMTWRWDDPLPTLALFAGTGPVLARLARRRGGSLPRFHPRTSVTP